MCNPLILVHFILHENIPTTTKAVMLTVQLEKKLHTYFLPKLFVLKHSLHYPIVFVLFFFFFFWGVVTSHLQFIGLYVYFFNYFIFYWRIIALQHFAVFCQTSIWISHRITYIPSLLHLHYSIVFWMFSYQKQHSSRPCYKVCPIAFKDLKIYSSNSFIHWLLRKVNWSPLL